MVRLNLWLETVDVVAMALLMLAGKNKEKLKKKKNKEKWYSSSPNEFPGSMEQRWTPDQKKMEGYNPRYYLL